jgi:hypothetical protein
VWLLQRVDAVPSVARRKTIGIRHLCHGDYSTASFGEFERVGDEVADRLLKPDGSAGRKHERPGAWAVRCIRRFAAA